MEDDNELYELDKHTAREYRLVQHTAGIAVACARHVSNAPDVAALVATSWDVLEFIEAHEREAHAAPERPVPYLPLNTADATAVLPLVTSRPLPPAVVPAVHVVAVPNGAAGAILPGPRLQLRHRSARPVVVRSILLADGDHLVTLPADGFTGATWEVRVPSAAYARAGTSPATGPAPYRAEDHAADACSRCGGWVKTDPARMVLPPPLGSLSATHPATLCGSCSEGLVDLVAAYVKSEPAPADGGSWPMGTGLTLRVDLDNDKCSNCLATIVRCNASGCGQRQAPGWRVEQRPGHNGTEVRG